MYKYRNLYINEKTSWQKYYLESLDKVDHLKSAIQWYNEYRFNSFWREVAY